MPYVSAIGGVIFLLLFTLGPLHWVSVGAPWVPIAIAFAAIPLIDAWVGAPKHPTRGSFTSAWFRWVPRVQLPAQAFLLLYALAIAPTLTWPDLIVFAAAVGTITGGVGITIAHELTHRESRIDRAIAKALLISVGYGHFTVEHVRGHHVRVGTPDDPATAPHGMSVYRFIVRSVVGSFRHAWKLEAMRLRHAGRSAFSPRNWVLSGTVLSLTLLAAAFAFSGAKGAVLFATQAAWAIVLLEIINYIEHYGLARRRVGSAFEPVRPEHSWNADYTVSNWILFNLQLHSDHHAHMERPYERLRSMQSAPQLPAGYPAMVLLALIPPAWFAVMHRRMPEPA